MSTGETVGRAHGESIDLSPDLRGIGIVETDNAKSALAESFVLRERRADLPHADDDDAPVAIEAEDLPHALRELVDGISETTLPERAEKGEILSHLRRGGAASGSQFIAGHGGLPRLLEFFEKAKVERESTNGGIGDPLQGAWALVNRFTR
jgi:hypothetical protein